MKFQKPVSKLLFASFAAAFLAFSPISERSLTPDAKKFQSQELIKKDSISKINPLQNLQAKTNQYCIHINLPEFKSRLYENDLQIDSAVISPGRFNSRSPVFQTWQNLITLRPSFSPTAAEMGRFSSNPPDRTSYPEKPRNALGRFRLVLYSSIRMHGTSLISSIAKFDSTGNVSEGKNKSNGCIRHDNFAGERIIAKIIKGSSVKKISSKFKDSISALIKMLKSDSLNPQDFITKTPARHAHNVLLENEVKICISYRLWNETISVKGDTLSFTLYRDIYNYAKGRAPAKKIPFESSLPQNAYSFEHFQRDLMANSICLNDWQAKQVYSQLSDSISKNKTPGKKIELQIPKNQDYTGKK